MDTRNGQRSKAEEEVLNIVLDAYIETLTHEDLPMSYQDDLQDDDEDSWDSALEHYCGTLTIEDVPFNFQAMYMFKNPDKFLCSWKTVLELIKNGNKRYA